MSGGEDSFLATDNAIDFERVAKENQSYELNDLKSQLEKQTIEIRRKDKENSNLQKQIVLLQKDAQENVKEIQLIKSRNAHLQKNLIDTKLEFEKYEEEDNVNKMKMEIKELFDQVSNWTSKHSALKADFDKSVKYISLMKQEQASKDLLLQEYREKDNAFKKDIEDMTSTNMVLHKLTEELRSDIKSSRSDLNKSEFMCCSLREENLKKEKQISDLEAALSHQKEEVKKLQGVIAIRNETNVMLRDQVDEVHQSLHTLTIDEWNSVKKIEQDNVSLTCRCKDLVKSVDLHMQLQKRAEEESNRTKEVYIELNAQFQSLQKEMEIFRSSNGVDTNALKQAQKEIKHLRKEKKELLTKLESGNTGGESASNTRSSPPINNNSATTPAVPSSSIAAFDDETRNVERRKRELAENSVQELRSRIFILLEQVDALFQLNLTWEEQKLVMQAEIAALHDTNRSLRKKLQGEADSEPLHHRTHRNNGESLPTGVEATIERYLFDLSCAFLSGKRAPLANNNSTGAGGANFKSIDGSFKVRADRDGFFRIEFVKGTSKPGAGSGLEIEEEDNNQDDDGYSKAFADDILNNLQISSFIKLVQERREVKILELFTDKLVSILNFHMNMSQELFNHIGESRMNAAKTVAQASIARTHIQKANEFAIKERTAKQVAVIKFVREQMRISDISTVVKDLEESCKDQTRKAENESNTSMLQGASNDLTISKDITLQIQSLLGDIKLINVPSGMALVPRGALELRLQGCQICDDTVHGIVSTLDGKLKESVDDTSSSSSALEVSSHLHENSNTSGSLPVLELEMKQQHEHRISALRGAIGGDNYFKKVILLNLRGNQLTDVACKMLTTLVERSPELRMLDLRDNFISITGKGILFDSVRRNKSVLYVSQKQNGDMIEGHREIVGSRSNNNNNNSSKQGNKGVKAGTADDTVGGSKYDFERLVGSAKFPLRIDIRGNESESNIIEDKLKTVFFGNSSKQGQTIPVHPTAAAVSTTSNNMQMAAYNRSKNASSGSNSSLTTNDKIALGYSIGQTAGSKSRQPDDSDNSDDDSQDKGVSFKKGIPSILDIIKNNAANSDIGQSNDVGKMLDEKIRHIEESAAFTVIPLQSVLSSNKFHASANIATPKKPTTSPQRQSVGNNNNMRPFSASDAFTSPNKMGGNNNNNNSINNNNNYNSNYHQASFYVDENVNNNDHSAFHSNDFDQTYPPVHINSAKYNQKSASSMHHSASASSIVRDKLIDAKKRDKGANIPLMSATTGGANKSSTLTRNSSRGGGSGTRSLLDGGDQTKSSSNLLEGLNRLNPSMLF